MKNIKGIALTDKGVLKTAVRNAIKTKDMDEALTALSALGYEYVEEKNAFVQAREDIKGNLVYTVLTMTVSTKHPSELAERKPRAKKNSSPDTFEVE